MSAELVTASLMLRRPELRLRWQGRDGGRMVSVALVVGGSFVICALASSSVKPGYPGTPVSQVHMKVKGVPRAGPQCEFPTLMTFIQAARWMDTSDQRKPLVKGTEYPVSSIWGYSEHPQSTHGGDTVDPTESALPAELLGSEATPFSTLAYAVGLARRGLCLFWTLL